MKILDAPSLRMDSEQPCPAFDESDFTSADGQDSDRDLSFKSEEVLDVNEVGQAMSDSIPGENVSDDVNIASLVLNDRSR